MQNESFIEQRTKYVDELMKALNRFHPDAFKTSDAFNSINAALEMAFSKGYNCCSKHVLKTVKESVDNF